MKHAQIKGSEMLAILLLLSRKDGAEEQTEMGERTTDKSGHTQE